MRIDHPHKGIITFTESRKGSLLCVLVISLVIGVWEWFVFGRPTSLQEFRPTINAAMDLIGPPLYVAASLPIPIVPLVLRRLAVAVLGRIITIDGTSRTIKKNNKILARFEEIVKVDVRNWDDGVVRMGLFLRGGRKVRVGKICNGSAFDSIVTEIHNIVEVATADDTKASLRQKGKIPLLIQIFAAVGVVFVILSLFILVRNVKYVTEGKIVTGIVLEVHERYVRRDTRRPTNPYKSRGPTSSGGFDIEYDCDIEFESSNGRTITILRTYGSPKIAGETVSLIYLEDNPEMALKGSNRSAKIVGPIIGIAFGIFWTLAVYGLHKFLSRRFGD